MEHFSSASTSMIVIWNVSFYGDLMLHGNVDEFL
jgi:hypothetical protein